MIAMRCLGIIPSLAWRRLAFDGASCGARTASRRLWVLRGAVDAPVLAALAAQEPRLDACYFILDPPERVRRKRAEPLHGREGCRLATHLLDGEEYHRQVAPDGAQCSQRLLGLGIVHDTAAFVSSDRPPVPCL